jgi:mannose-6-phosphate isomerase class I
VAKIVNDTPEQMYGLSRFAIWAATEEGARLEIVQSTAETQNEAEQQAEAWMRAHPKGVAYVLKAIHIFMTDRGDPASPGAGHGSNE